MELFERVKFIAKQLAGSETKLAAILGLPQRKFNGYLNQISQRNLWEYLPLVLDEYPSLSRDWLYFGEGEPFADSSSPVSAPGLLSAREEASPYQRGGLSMSALDLLARLEALERTTAELAQKNAALEAELDEERRLNRQLVTRLLIDGAGDKGASTTTAKSVDGAS